MRLFVLLFLLIGCSSVQKTANIKKRICYRQTERDFCAIGFEIVGIIKDTDNMNKEICCPKELK